jgi:hypothetical protein
LVDVVVGFGDVIADENWAIIKSFSLPFWVFLFRNIGFGCISKIGFGVGICNGAWNQTGQKASLRKILRFWVRDMRSARA